MGNAHKQIFFTEKGTLAHCSWECKLVQTSWETVWSFFKQLKIE